MAVQSGLAGLGALLRLRATGACSRWCRRRAAPGMRAVSSWDGEADINSCSIGIEIANPGHPGGLPPFPDAQIESVAALAKDIVSRWRIPATHVLAHSDVAPGRKVDPGEAFPWRRLHEAGVGHWVAPAPIRDGRFFSRGDQGMPIEALQAMLAMYGYGLRITGVVRRGHGKGRRGLPAPFPARARRRRCRCLDHHDPARPDRHAAAYPAHDKELTRTWSANRPQSPLMTSSCGLQRVFVRQDVVWLIGLLSCLRPAGFLLWIRPAAKRPIRPTASRRWIAAPSPRAYGQPAHSTRSPPFWSAPSSPARSSRSWPTTTRR